MSVVSDSVAEIEKAPDSYEAVANFGRSIAETFLEASLSPSELQNQYPETGAMLRDFISEGQKLVAKYNMFYIPEAASRLQPESRQDDLNLKDLMKRKDELYERLDVMEEIQAGWRSFARDKYLHRR